MTTTQAAELQGMVRGHRSGYGFVDFDDDRPSVYLPAEEMQGVLHGDQIKLEIRGQDQKGRPTGHVLEILHRRTTSIVGRLLREGRNWAVAPEDRRYGQDVLIARNGLAGAQEGAVVVVELTEAPALHGRITGRVREVLGELDDPGIEIEIAVHKFGVPDQFSKTCQKAVAALPDAVQAQERRGRIDLTDIPFVTIDGADSRDFDDAVYCEPLDEGAKGWRLLVAIADVSHYVSSGGPIDEDAYERATSVYFPRQVIPMLPEALCNGLCSLNPGVDRLSLICDMVIGTAGQAEAYQFYPAVVRSQARLTYDQVAAALVDSRNPDALALGERLSDILELHALFTRLLQARQRRGAIDFDLPETQIVCDDDGRILAIEPTQRNDAHRMIEECMLVANTCAADFLQLNKRRALYRVHDKPAGEKVQALREHLASLGLQARLDDEPTPMQLQELARSVQGRDDAEQIQMLILRAMSQAVYSPDNAGHFGLAYGAYTHFTSPIRRYPDLLVHRVIRAILEGKSYRLGKLPDYSETDRQFAPRRPPDQGRKKKGRSGEGGRKPSAQQVRWEEAGKHCSACERRADEASRDVEAWLKCDYMRGHLGESFDGTVSTVVRFGLFVTLDDLYVDGLVHVNELGDEYFVFDEARQTMRGEHTGLTYSVGKKVRVQVSRVDLDARNIDFRILREESGRRSPVASHAKGRGKDKKQSPAGGRKSRTATHRAGKQTDATHGKERAKKRKA